MRVKKLPTLLEMLKTRYEESGNPVYAIRGFLICRQNRMEVEGWVMKWLGRGLIKYFKSRGKGDLEKLLGFKRGKGKRSAFEEMVIVERNRRLIQEEVRLRIHGLLQKESYFRIAKKEGLSSRTVQDVCLKKSAVKK